MDAAFNADNARPAGTLVEHLAAHFTVLSSHQSVAASGGNLFAGQARAQPAFPLPDPPAVFNGSSVSMNARKRSASSGASPSRDVSTSGYTLKANHPTWGKSC
eukprot:8056277-Karenia_brevis.AAC.1